MDAADDLKAFFEYGVHLGSRTIYVGAVVEDLNLDAEISIGPELAGRVLRGLRLLDRASGEITLIVNNPGGDVYHALAIYDAVRECQNYVTARVYGQAMSGAAIILQAADRRLVSPQARLMIHYGSRGTSGDAISAVRQAEDSDALNRAIEDILLLRMRALNPKLGRGTLRRYLAHDTYYSATQAVAAGLADALTMED